MHMRDCRSKFFGIFCLQDWLSEVDNKTASLNCELFIMITIRDTASTSSYQSWDIVAWEKQSHICLCIVYNKLTYYAFLTLTLIT